MKHQVFMLLFAYVDIDTIFAIIYGRRVSHFNITGEVSMSETNSSNIGFEKQIWDAACVLRGNMDASEYKSVVLGLIFLKYISDRFEAKYKELVEEGDGFEEDKDEYTAENIFFVPENARWEVIAAAAHTPEIGTVIDDAMRSIEKENKRLKDILPKNFARPELDKRRLGEVVDLFTNIQMIEHGESKDILGRTYEYCLAKFAEQEGKNAGEFYTPSCVVRTLVEVLQPFNGRVYDPCCGSGGMFVQSAKFVENHGGNINKISVFGQDSNPTTWKMAQMNLAIRGIEADLGKFNADTFFNDCHPQLKADYIMANPPFNLSGWGQEKLLDDVRWKYGTPPVGNANFAWLQHMIWHLAPNGRIGMVLANGSLSSQSGGEGEIRKNIIEDDLVDCIVAMPSQLFYTTQIPVSLWFLARNKKQKGKTLFIDARKMGTSLCERHPGGYQGVLCGGHHPGYRQAGLYPHAGAVCGHRGAGGRRRTLRGKDGTADLRTVRTLCEVPRTGGTDQGAAGGDWI